jgi:quinol monooxygenase YgiN
MSVRLILYGKVTDMDAFKAVGADMVAAAEGEDGTTVYKWHVSEDGRFVNEDVYSDEAAMFAHVGAATEAGNLDKWMASMELEGVMVLDPVSDEAKEALAGFGGVHYSMVMGF